MSKFSEKYLENAESQTFIKEAEKIGRETLGKYYYDLSKLAFATSVLNGTGTIFAGQTDTGRIANIITGLVMTVMLAILGHRTLKLKTK